MRQFSAALLTRAMGPVKAFFSSPCGRHSAAVAGRRRRSTRVRRYAPAPATPARASAAQPLPERPAHPDIPASAPAFASASAPRLAPPPERLPADDIALVRPYYAFHERELARTQAEATARPHRWIPRPRPTGDLLADPAPAPPPHSPPREWDELAALTRLWITQQDQRQRQRQAVPA